LPYRYSDDTNAILSKVFLILPITESSMKLLDDEFGNYS
jgi:hypothetical protein